MSDMVCELGRIMSRLWEWRRDGGAKPDGGRLVRLTEAFAELLESAGEYSLVRSLEDLAKVHPLNPVSEETLKGNAENSYCRTYIAELARAIYIPETEFWRDWLESAGPADRADKEMLLAAEAKIRDAFYAHPLRDFQIAGKPLAPLLRKIEKI